MEDVLSLALKIRDDLAAVYYAGPRTWNGTNGLRYNGECLAGLHNQPRGRPQRRLDPAEEAAHTATIARDPDPAENGCCAWTRADLCRWLEAHHGKTCHPSSVT